MLIRLGEGADHGFREPLGLLSDCHRRIERFLAALVSVAARGGASLAPQDRRLLETALHYFATAAPRHTADEEESLFPRLRASGDPQAATALDAVQRLEADHRRAEVHHAAVDDLGRRWLAGGTLPDTDAAALERHLEALQQLYGAHIDVEDRELFPTAARLLSQSELEAMGREMADRRGVPFDPPRELD
jgi:hemerythrin-like domain-containing protein